MGTSVINNPLSPPFDLKIDLARYNICMKSLAISPIIISNFANHGKIYFTFFFACIYFDLFGRFYTFFVILLVYVANLLIKLTGKSICHTIHTFCNFENNCLINFFKQLTVPDKKWRQKIQMTKDTFSWPMVKCILAYH